MDWLERVARAASQGLRYLTGEADTARDSIIRAFEDNFDGLVVIGEDYRVIAASRRAAEMLVGAEGGSITGRQVSGFLPEIMLRTVQETFAAGRINAPTPMALARIGTPPNEEYIVQFVANLSEMSARFGSVPRRIVNLTFWDETERRRREEELAFIGTHDMLTGAVTRAELMRIANASLEGERRRASGLSLLIVELRRLRKINETLGRVYGDMVRKQAVSRIKAAGIESVARLGDNAFALIRYGRMRDEEVRAFCENLIERLTLPYWLNQHRALIGVSIGLTHTEVSGFDPEVLLSHAELALAAASAQPGNTFVAFTTAMDQRFRERQVMDLALRQARLRGELSLHYEPQMAFATGEVIGAEAILRWRHPTLGVIPPETFVPAAEENGEIIDIGRWALQEACRAAADWPSPMRLAIDVSPVQFAFADM
ncbi:MAG TPA: EAL domain-containing protein, partial [Alphaproteobacteria bacterium]|nr:EAL domain-containing protein [Alphaproteobacteria bacterium]